MPDGPGTLAVRQEAVHVAPAENGVTDAALGAVVMVARFLGSAVRLELRAGSDVVVHAGVAPTARFAPGDPVVLRFAETHVLAGAS